MNKIEDRPGMGPYSSTEAKTKTPGEGSVAEKARDLASSVTEKAREAVSTATDKARDTASTVAGKASEMGASVGHSAEEATAAVGCGMKSLAGSIREHAPQSGMLRTASTNVAESLESGGRYLQEEGLRGIGEDLTNLVRRNPVPALLLALGAGYLFARATRS